MTIRPPRPVCGPLKDFLFATPLLATASPFIARSALATFADLTNGDRGTYAERG